MARFLAGVRRILIITLFLSLATLLFVFYTTDQHRPLTTHTQFASHPVTHHSLTFSERAVAWIVDQEIKRNISSAETRADLVNILSEPAVNFHDFRYIHNRSDFCSQPPEVLFVIPSAPENFRKRDAVRHGPIGTFVKEPRNKAKFLFFIGNLNPNTNSAPGANRSNKRKSKEDILKSLEREINTFNDIVQEDFEDVYPNIRLKAVSMLKWVSYFCPGSKFIIRTDDDVKVNPAGLVAAMARVQSSYDHFILGRVLKGTSPTRQKDYKSYMSIEEYPHQKLPDFVLGGLMGYPTRTVKLLYQLALRVKVIWLDDVYVSGLCAQLAGIPLLADDQFAFEH